MSIPSHNFEQDSSNPGDCSLAQIIQALCERLVLEKTRLLEALADSELVSTSVRTNYGAFGHLKDFPGTLYINCSPSTRRPHHSVGRGNDKEGTLRLYQWIPIIYITQSHQIFSYSLNLCQEDLDVASGNIHAVFSALQISRLEYKGSEVGGQANPKPNRIEDGYALRYLTDRAFPRAVRGVGSGRTVYRDKAPWGYENFTDIPSLSMASDTYDPVAVARFTLKLIAYDIRMRSRVKKTSPKGRI